MADSDVPVLPWEINLRSVAWFITDDADGGKLLKLVPIAPTPQGMAPTGMAIEIHFDPAGWDKFMGDVSLGERHISKVVVPQPGQKGHIG